MTITRFRTVLGLALLAVAPALSAGGGSPQMLLLAEFDEQPLDQPIGTGGAAMGQPVNISTNIAAVVRAMPMSSQSLELTWTEPRTWSEVIRFHWLDNLDITSGTVEIVMDVHPGPLSQYLIRLREPTTATRNFGELRLTSGGRIWVADATGDVQIAFWQPDTPFSVLWTYDMDAGTFDVAIDGIMLVDDRPHGVAPGMGLGSILVGFGSSSAPDSRLSVDNIVVTHTPSDMLFADGFESSP